MNLTDPKKLAFLPNHLSAITSGAPMLVAADGHQQEVAHIFRIFEKVQKMKLLEPKN